MDTLVSKAKKKGRRHRNPWIVIDSPVANQIFSGSLVKDKSNTDAAPGACGVAPTPVVDGFVVLPADDGAEGLGGIGVVGDVRGGVDVEAEAPEDEGVVEGEDSPCTSTNC